MIRKWSVALLGWGAVLGLLAPMLHTIWVSFSPDSFLTPPTNVWSIKWYLAYCGDRRWVTATLQSLAVAGMASVLAVAVGAPAAWSWPKLTVSRQRLLSILLLLPALIPPAALGFGLLPLVYFTGLWGTSLGLVLVHATVGLPIVFLIVRTCFTEELGTLETAAAGLGANRWEVLRRVTLPLLTPVLVTAGIAVFVLSLNESLVSIFLATPTNETLPSVIWPQLRYSPSPLVAVASCVTALLGIVGMLIGLGILSYQRGRIFSKGAAKLGHESSAVAYAHAQIDKPSC